MNTCADKGCLCVACNSKVIIRVLIWSGMLDLEGEKSRSVSNPCVPVSSYDGVNRTNGGHFPEQEIGQETQGVNEHMKGTIKCYI